MRLSKLPVVLLAALLGSCGGGGGSSGNCSVAAEKDFVIDVAYDWYLFLDLLPSSVNPFAFSSADQLLDHLTAEARAQGKDRFFSFLTSAAEEGQFFDEGTAVAFGILTLCSDDDCGQLFIGRVNSNSPASAAGFIRGDEILAIDSQPIASMSDEQLDAAFGPPQVGLTRTFQVRTPQGQTVERTISKAVIQLDTAQHSLIAREGLSPIGYLSFETFINPAAQPLRAAFQEFKDNGVQDVIVDLRYNGGGLVDIAELLANLLAADEENEVMFVTHFNEQHDDGSGNPVQFSLQTQSIPAMRIAFITTNGTASASELVMNSLEPYAQVAIIGQKTFGKPVGQFGFDLQGCDTLLRLVAFQDFNADGEGDYFGGLPNGDFDGASCAVEDDLSAARGDPAEASTGMALTWIDTGTCPSPIATAKSATAFTRYPKPARPNLVQENLPGFF